MELTRLEKEVEALRLVAPLLSEEKEINSDIGKPTLALLQDFFADPMIRALDIRGRRFITSRGDIIREKESAGRSNATSGILAITWEVVLHDTHAVITAEEYLALLERERAAGAAAGAGAGAAAGVGVP